MNAVLHDLTSDVPLSQIKRGNLDKLGNRIEEVYWCGSNYAIYRTPIGVFVHFSDTVSEAREQRHKFTAICPELCELRYLTQDMDRQFRVFGIPFPKFGAQKDSIFDHNIAQAIMLLMEGKAGDAKEIAKQALHFAVSRATSDNTIRYVRASVIAAVLSVALIIGAVLATGAKDLILHLWLGAGFGAVGSLFSIITRLQSFALKPCEQSSMNYLMSVMRVMMGVIAGPVLILIVHTPLGSAIVSKEALTTWYTAAVLGFLGGFAERLVQTVAQRAAKAMGDSTGTVVQAARKAQKAAA